MKFLTKILLILLLTSVSNIGIAYAEDVLIIHQGYGNTASKWKNRLEDAGHTVTSVNVSSSSFPSNTTSYEQIYDIRYSNTHALTTTQKNAYEALLERGGTLFLNTENPHSNHQTRNTGIATFITSLGAGTVTYSSSYAGNGTQWNTTHSYVDGMSGTLTMPAAGTFSALGNGDWLVRDADGDVVAAVWYGEDLDGDYSDGIIFVFTDINYASHSSYYTNNNKAFMNALRTALASTWNQPTSAVSRSSSQTTTLNAAIAATSDGNLVYIEQTGAGSTIDIFQDGADNFIVDTDWSGPAVLNGSNQILDVDQLTSDNGIALGMIGNNIEVTVAQGTSGTNGGHKAIIDIDAASNVVGLTQYDAGTLSQHFALIDVDGASNNIQVTQRDNGQKILFMDVDIISGDIDIMQRDTGTHFLELNLTGSASHDVDITQQGTGDHAARVTLGGGYATNFDLNQQGSSDQSYDLNSTCSNALGCTVNVTQGN